MRILLNFVVFMIVLMGLNACVTTVPVKVRKPAEFNVGAIRSLAVLDFEFRGEWDLSGGIKPSKHKSINALRRILMRKMKLDPLKAYPGSLVRDRLVDALIQNGYYTITERARIEQVLQEQALRMSGLTDDTHAAEVGRMIGADGLMTGEGRYFVRDQGAWEAYTVTEKDKNGKKKKVTKKRYRLSRFVSAMITYRLIDVQSGRVVASKTNRMANYAENGYPGMRGKSAYTVTGKDEKDAAQKLTDWRAILDMLVEALNQQCVAQIAPHVVTEKRVIKEGDSKMMKTALGYAKRDLWEDAQRLWRQVLDHPPSKEEKIAAMYNLGVYYEVFGFLNDAEHMFKQCYEQSGDEAYLDDQARVRRRMEELRRLREQENAGPSR